MEQATIAPQSAEKHTQVRAQVQAYLAQRLGTGISQNQLATELGVSAAQLINIKRGDWEQVSEKMLNGILVKTRANNWALVSTPNLKYIEATCNDARQNRRLLSVFGYTGAGKTTGLTHVRNTTVNTAYVLANTLMNRKTFLQAILKACGRTEYGSCLELMQAIVRHLNSTSDVLLIIDDAGKLNDNCLRLVQILFDETEGNAGIVLAGTEKLRHYIDQCAAKDKLGFREIKRRIAFWQAMKRPTGAVVKNIVGNYGIVDSNAVEYLAKYADNYGTLKEYVTNALKVATGADVNRELLVGLSVGG